VHRDGDGDVHLEALVLLDLSSHSVVSYYEIVY
jgi:hypothetical protein